MNKQIKKEILIIAAMILTAMIVIAVMRISEKGNRIVVFADDKEYGTYNLNIDREIEIKSESGVNILKIENGQARMISASCPDKICVHMSPLSKDTVGLIVCLPNRVVVEVKEE